MEGEQRRLPGPKGRVGFADGAMSGNRRFPLM
jgi:hypothetical protein